MKAKDLMIGDWVAVHRPGDRYEQVRVKSVIGNGTIEAKTSDGLVAIGESAVEPIPLTAEILEKNGFKWDELPKFAVNEITEKTKMTFSYHLGSRTVFVGVNEPNFNLTSACVLYVHELQHILRQSRIEKEIIL